jgi:hypothetical protein
MPGTTRGKHTDFDPVCRFRCQSENTECLPFLGRANIRHLMGVVVLRDVLNLYGITQRE